MTMKSVHVAAFTLLVIGGLNWLLYAVLGWDISRYLGGMDSAAARVIYILIGLAAIYELATHRRNCALCGEPSHRM